VSLVYPRKIAILLLASMGNMYAMLRPTTPVQLMRLGCIVQNSEYMLVGNASLMMSNAIGKFQ
jgi:hypothetical protein